MGTYVLALWLDIAQVIRVGRLGPVDFAAGWLLYVGSALGPGGVPARLARHWRHLGPDKRAHWHVDAVRDHAAWAGAWYRPSGERLECAWAAALRCLPGSELPAPGIGASDCRCPGHLIHLAALPAEAWFATTLGAERIAVSRKELEDLLHLLTTGSEEGREAAALALGRFGTAAVAPLSDLLAHDQAETRWWAARALALGQVGDEAAAPDLAARLADESTFVAGIAGDALSMIGEGAVPALAAALDSPGARARLLAVRALGRIRSQSAVGPLLGVLDDPSYLVQHDARDALEALGVGMVFLAP